MIDRITSAQFRQRQGLPPPGQSGSSVAPKSQARPQIRLPKPRKMNKTEARYYEILQRRHHPALAVVMYEPLTLRLPSGTKYTPDFMLFEHTNNLVEFFEVKGPHIHNSASIRAFKEARAAFPMWKFTFAQYTKNGWTTAS